MPNPRILLTGATGYIGGRLLRVFEDSKTPIRCVTRSPERLSVGRPCTTEIVQGDAMNRASLLTALQGIEIAYYLVHSMGMGVDFAEQDRTCALNFVEAAQEAGVKRIVYVGGLGNSTEELSKHLTSRHETGEILRSSNIEVIELRAAIVIGSGSLSFEMVRALAERLPAMICPRWVEVDTQPIAIEDLVDYLTECLALPFVGSRIYEIGGPEVSTYGEVMREYMRQRNLKRLMIPIPFLSPYLSSLWLGLVTPVYARIGRKLVQSLKNSTVVRDNSALIDFHVRPMNLKSAIERALINEDKDFAQTRWSDSVSSGGQRKRLGASMSGTRIVDSRAVTIDSSAESAFAPIQKIGGTTGWYFGDWLWRIRGFIDLLAGGVGMRRGRGHPISINIGDSLDFWRVEQYEQNRLLRLSAEMKLPGRAWLQFETVESPAGTTITQSAIFDPKGVSGLLYWYALYPLHFFVFRGMLSGIAREARIGNGTNTQVVGGNAK